MRCIIIMQEECSVAYSSTVENWIGSSTGHVLSLFFNDIIRSMNTI
jgi:hypothetical protein